MRLPVAWSRSRATALGVTLELHAVALWWLLALRFELPETRVEDLGLSWVPLPLTPPPPQEPGCNKEGVGQSCGR